MRILLVSGHPSVSQQVRTAVLGLDGVDVTEVATPHRALALLDAGDAFDVVVGDNDTAPEGGLSLCREVKARGQMRRAVPPVVLLLARPQDRWLARWAQADAHVLKPADPFDLLEVLHAVVAGQDPPALPGVGGDPLPSLLDLPPEERRAAVDRGDVIESAPFGTQSGTGAFAGPV